MRRCLQCGSNSNFLSCSYEQEVNIEGQQASAIEDLIFSGALFCADGLAVRNNAHSAGGPTYIEYK